MIVVFCENCGWMIVTGGPNEEHICKCCGNKMIVTNLESTAFYHMTKEQKDEYRKALLGDKQISQEMTLKRLEFEAKRHADIQREFAGYAKESNSIKTAKCPYCNSTNTKKIGAGGRLLSTLTFGIASGKMGKQWHCKNCGSDF